MMREYRTGFLKDKLKDLKDKGLYRTLSVINGPNGPVVNIGGKQAINLCANNYLGFANLPRIKEASIRAIEKYGVGSGAVRTIVGNLEIHEELDSILAEFKREEKAFHFQSGLNCNMGIIQAIVEKGDLIISDELNHASIIDGIKLSKADKAVFKHADVDDLLRIVKEKRQAYNRVLIITDGVFSMDGDLAPLPEIVKIAKEYNCLLYVDDAHGSGVLGEGGRGTVDHFGLHGQVDFIIGTLSKAIGVIGGYVAGSKETAEWLIHYSRPTLFSTALSPGCAGAIIEAIRILMETTEYTEKLWANGKELKTQLSSLGFNIGNSQTPITPIIVGDEAKTIALSKALLENGVFASGIIFPTVPKGTGRIRLMPSAAHTQEHIHEAVRIIQTTAQNLRLI